MASNQSPLSAFRYCPKCSTKEFQADSGKSLKCNACGFRYYINMNAAVAAIIRNDQNEILFTIRKHEPAAGMLDLPGGFVDLGETAEGAIVREVFEELNIKITDLAFFGSYTNKYVYCEIEYQTLDLVFNCLVENYQNMQAADDVSGFVFRELSLVHESEIGLDSIKKIVRQLKIHL